MEKSGEGKEQDSERARGTVGVRKRERGSREKELAEEQGGEEEAKAE